MFSKYRYVYAVYQERSFTKAAGKLFISQPSLSAAIKTVESRIGAPLFERTSGEVHLTEIGQQYIAAAKKIIIAEEEFTNKLHDIYNLETGRLLIGASNYLSSYVLPKILKRFTSLYPKIEVSLVSANSAVLRRMVEDDRLDILVDSFDRLSDAYQGDPLHKERILLCVPIDRPVNEHLKAFQIDPESIYRGEVDFDTVPVTPIATFENEAFVLLGPGNDMYERAMAIFEQAHISPEVSFSVDQITTSYALMASHLGCCFMTDTFFKYERFREPVALYNVTRELGTRTLYAVYKRGKYCSKAMRAFMDVASQVV